MYIREASYDWFMLSEDLSFGTVVTPSPLSLMIVIMINEMNSVLCTMRALHKRWFFFPKGLAFLQAKYKGNTLLLDTW